MHIHFLFHETFEGPGCINTWLADHSHTSASTQLFTSDPEFPDTNDFDFLIIMGGGMSVYEEATYPWLKKEKDFIRRSIEDGKLILGICLGSQLLASALDAKVYPAEKKEIGWHPITFADNKVTRHLFPDLTEFVVFHWHGDTFDLPQGAAKIASSEATPNQGFFIDERIVGLQFHFEATKPGIEALIKNASHDITDGPFVQSPLEMRQGYLNNVEPNNMAMFKLLNLMTQNALQR